ncbi:hypothetical protein GCM10009539_17360 [Cryptosporangium japonicum]|uniref:Uncharacterized protein n=1 Tax=Cryptosporangium japonicum TaxID=80872 RepID=A0ABN0TXA9_9ACTN
MYAVYAQLDALAGAAVDDPRVEATAAAMAAVVPAEMLAGVVLPGEDELTGRDGFTAAMFAEFAPAQVAAVRGAISRLRAVAGGAEEGRLR